MKLSEITDPMRRALLDPEGCAYWDFYADQRCSLVWAPVLGGHSAPRRRTTQGDALLAEAQRIAQLLTPEEVATLREDTTCFYEMDARTPVQHGLLRRMPGPGIGGYEVTPAGRLVLELRERGGR